MSPLALTFAYLRQRPLQTALNVLLLALGLATIVVLLLVGRQVERGLARGSEGIDFVVGAKGSPLQLILSSVYHLDSPTGNIPLAEARRLEQHPAVGAAIPLALGDSWNGYRIVGSTPDYVAHYEGAVAEGRLWEAEGEVVLGARTAAETGKTLGDEIVSAHGFEMGGPGHGDMPLRVVGILAPGAAVLDALVLTSVETIWAVHGLHGEMDESTTDEGAMDGNATGSAMPGAMPAVPHADDDLHTDDIQPDPAPPTDQDVAEEPLADLAPADGEPAGSEATVPPAPMGGPMGGMMPGGMPGMMPAPAGPELTALLIRASSPMAVALFPRFVNSQTNLQAAVPAFELQRLLRLVGLGVTTLRLFGLVLLVVAGLSVFAALYGAMQERRYDLALMRTLGASRGKLFGLVLLEGLVLAVLGTLLGLALGHGAVAALGTLAPGDGTTLALSGWTWAPAEWALVALALGVGFVASRLPAFQAYSADIAPTLARG